jgi:hypothetical protein
MLMARRYKILEGRGEMKNGRDAFVDLNVQLLALERRQAIRGSRRIGTGGLYLLRDKALSVEGENVL